MGQISFQKSFYGDFHDTGDTPTLLRLKGMKGRDGTSLQIIEKIAGGDYTTFGMYLLQDENEVEVDLLKKTHANDGPEGITKAILKKWLTSGAPTCTYQHLIECLRQSGLGALAKDISGRGVGGGMSTDM